MTVKQLIIVVFALNLSSQAYATWNLDGASSDLTFVSTKAIDIAEVHRFTELSGRISDNGKAVITIDLRSVDTAIPVRDERMQSMLFETDKYPAATVRTKIEMDALDALQSGDSVRLDTEFELDLHGNSITINGKVVVTRLTDTLLQISSAQPLILNAADIELAEGIEALRKVANLPSISAAVPVTFTLIFMSSE